MTLSPISTFSKSSIEEKPRASLPNSSKSSTTIMAKICSHKNLMAYVEQSKALSRKAKPIAFLFNATKMSKTTK
jgi:hypothetical protein